VKAGEIWRFKVGEKDCYLRVVLKVSDLGLPANHPMAFVNDCVLAQVTRSGAAAFRREALLVDGLFFGYQARQAKKAGFERVGGTSIEMSEIECPAWLIDDSKRGILLCRGELLIPVSAADPKGLYRRWDVRLSPKYPEQLPDAVAAFEAFQGKAQEERPKRILGIPGSDVRYHPDREALLRDIGISMELPYITELERHEPDRMGAYRSAISA
jgi:hypothetical protein